MFAVFASESPQHHCPPSPSHRRAQLFLIMRRDARHLGKLAFIRGGATALATGERRVHVKIADGVRCRSILAGQYIDRADTMKNIQLFKSVIS